MTTFIISVERGIQPAFCPNSLKSPMEKILLNSKVQGILKILGDIYFQVSDCEQFETRWSWKEKTIKIDRKFLKGSEAKIIGAVVFELFNALQTNAFKEIIKTKKNVEDLVRSFEKLEHNSAILTQALVPEIVKKGEDFGFNDVHKDFSLHYALNQIRGHSEWIAETYLPDQFYRGTLHSPLSEIDKNCREILYSLLYYKFKEENGQTCPIRFQDLMKALEKKSESDSSYRKVLMCARALFPK